MDRKKNVVTLTDIKKYCLKGNIFVIYGFILILFTFSLEAFTANGKHQILFSVFMCMISIFGIGRSVYEIVKIHKNNYYTIREDVLLNKADDICTLSYGHETHRLYFHQNYYDMRVYGKKCGLDGKWYGIYNMGTKTIYNTASVGDSFTLVCVGKKIILAFNNKLFDIRNDL